MLSLLLLSSIWSFIIVASPMIRLFFSVALCITLLHGRPSEVLSVIHWLSQALCFSLQLSGFNSFIPSVMKLESFLTLHAHYVPT